MTEINKTFPELLDDSFIHLHFIQEMFQNQLSYAFDMSFHLKKNNDVIYSAFSSEIKHPQSILHESFRIY